MGYAKNLETEGTGFCITCYLDDYPIFCILRRQYDRLYIWKELYTLNILEALEIHLLVLPIIFWSSLLWDPPPNVTYIGGGGLTYTSGEVSLSGKGVTEI